jgi:hypothetical protein
LFSSFRTLFRNHFGLFPGQSLPSRDGDVDEAGFQLDRIAAPPELLGRDEPAVFSSEDKSGPSNDLDCCLAGGGTKALETSVSDF